MITELLNERGDVYGDFGKGTKLEAAMLRLIADSYKFHHNKQMDDIHMIYLSKIVMKLVRLAVSPKHLDSWVDLSGYATLVAFELQEESK